MNDQALQDSYKLFTETGYNGSLEDYQTLLSENEEARSDAHKLFTNTGYDGGLEDFSNLVGIGSTPEKKNQDDSTDLSLDDSNSGSQLLDVQPVGFAQGSGVKTTEALPEGEEKEVSVNKGRLTGTLSQALGEMSQEEDEAISRWAGYQGGADVDAPNTQAEWKPQSGENISPFLATLARIEEKEAEDAIKKAGSSEEVRAIIRKKNADKVNAAYNDAMLDNSEAGMSETEFTDKGETQKGGLLEFDEEGKAVFNQKNLGLTLMDMDKVAAREAAIVERERAAVEGKTVVGLIAHDMATGIMDITNSVQGLYDRAGAQDDFYENTFRTQASYTEYGLSEDEVSKGVSKNLQEGNISAASKVFAVQAAQTTPQLLAQVAIAYGTGGLGASASTAMWASSGFMGATTFGRTWADTYGQVSNDKAFMMALGDAAVETLSEKLFAGDVKALAGLEAFAGMTRKQIKSEMFGKGLLSKEFGKFALATTKNTLKQGAEEGLEEVIATVGSGIVHAAINDEEINLYEVMDSAIIGFGMGAGSAKASRITGRRGLLTAGVSALGYGGLRTEMIKLRGNKQALTQELLQTTDVARKEQLQTKLKDIESLERGMSREQELAYEQYTDEDAANTIDANQKLSNVLSKLRNDKTLTDEQTTELKTEAKSQFGIIENIESKYDALKTEISNQNKVNTSFLNRLDNSLNITSQTILPDTPLMRGISNIAKALESKGTKVFIHKNLDQAAETAGVDKMEIAGSNGFYKAADGSIHIMASLAQNNTAYHEGFHDILRDVDPEYAERFVNAAFQGMEGEMLAKYKSIYDSNKKKGGEKLAVEEVFAELNADIATGAISQEGAGTSVVHAAMGSLRTSVNFLLGNRLKQTPSFKEFTNYVSKVVTDFQVGDAVTANKGAFGSNPVSTENFMQMSESQVDGINTAKEPTVKVPKGKTFNGSFINGDTNFTNVAEVVENFKKENGRAPKILFWMGDQSARGTYTTLDGNGIELEGGISFSQDSKNTDQGVVWATNKNNAEVQGLVKDADIVAIVSGKPETGHRFYKGTSVVVGTELMEAMNRKKGSKVVYPQRGGNFEIEIPAEGFTDPLQAMRFFYSTLADNGITLTKPTEFMEKSEGINTQQEYLDGSKGDRMGALDFFLEPSATAVSFFENLGMKSMADVQNDVRDGYLVENEFTTGDIYAFYEFERGADGSVQTQDGNHSTYSTDIKGKAIGIANRKDNIYQIADIAASTTTENKLSGKSKLELLKEEGYVTQEELDALNTLEDSKIGQAKNKLIREASRKVKIDGNTVLASRLSGKGGYVSAQNAGDKSLKRIVSDAGTSYDGDALLESLIVGQTADGRADALRVAAEELVAEGQAKEVEFEAKKVKFLESVLPVGMILERAAKNEGVSFETMQNSVNAETKRKASIFHQATIVDEVAQRILLGEKKAAIIASLRAKGMSSADANLVFAKANQYAKGAKKGWSEGTKERSAQMNEKRNAQRKAESAKAKDFRKKAAAILKQEKKTGDVILREIMNLIKEAGVEIKASQVNTLIRIAKKVSRTKGRGILDIDARYELLSAVVDKVVMIIDKQLTAKGLDEYTNRLRKVEGEQKKLKDRFKALKPTSRSPLISYADQILDIVSINPAMLSPESLILIENTISDLNMSTKSVSVKKGDISNPYVFVEGLGNVDTRRAKIYFNEIFENLQSESMTMQEQAIVNKATDLAVENGTSWVAEYEALLRDIAKKDLKGVQKKLVAIAEDMGLDINDINDFAIVEQLYQEEKAEAANANKAVIISDAILPTFANFRRLFESNKTFKTIFGITEELDDVAALELVRARMNNMSGIELKRIEFAMYDFAVNGKALGITALAAATEAKNDGNSRLKALNIKSREKEGVGKGFYSRFENTPMFLRRLFLTSEAKIAQFMEITGFSELRSQVALADTMANQFQETMVKTAKEYGVTSIGSQVKMQIFSVLRQMPSGKNETQYLAQVIAQIELSFMSDKRYSESQRKDIRTAIDEMLYSSDSKRLNYKDIMANMEGTQEANFVEGMSALFGIQGIRVKQYAEEFLGMNFKEENNYLPISFRSVGSTNDNIAQLQESVENIQQAFQNHSLSKQGGQASSTFERNDESMGSKNRYLDLNFFDTLTNTYRENEVKTRTAFAVAKVTASTSEGNDTFKGVVTEPEQRQRLRKKIVLFLTDKSTVAQQQDELLGTSLKKFVNEMNNLTVLYYFGSVFTQLFKQSSAIMNTVIEGGNVLTLLGYTMTAVTGKYNSGQKAIMMRSDIGQRDFVKETVSATTTGNAMEENTNWSKLRQKGFELSTLALKQTDKVAATASWFAYFEQYQRRENGFEGEMTDQVWKDWAFTYDKAAADYASLMVSKDQNISTSRDKSEFRRINSSQAAQVIQMLVMPFANFLLNKKMNLMLDFQKLGKSGQRVDAVKSIGGTALEIAAFHGLSQFVIAPLVSTIASAAFGGGSEEEEDSWYNAQFRKDMFVKGMLNDINPLVLPVGIVETMSTTAYNMLNYMATPDGQKQNFEDRSFMENFTAWEKLNGLPKFGAVGRGDMSLVSTLKGAGVYGDMTVEMVTGLSNLKTLNEKNPYYTTSFGSVKYISTKDAESMLKLEATKVALMTGGALTGLFSKEAVQAIKMRERQIGKRGTSNENEAIGKQIINESKGTDLMVEKIQSMVKDNPLAIENTISAIVGDGAVKSIMADRIPSKKNINTIRDIQLKTKDPRDAGFAVVKIMKTMTAQEAEEFKSDVLKYYALKSETSLTKLVMIINTYE